MQKIMFNDTYKLTAAVLAGRKTMTRRVEFDESAQQQISEADAVGYGQGCCQLWKNGRIERQITSRYKVGEVVVVAQSYKSIFEEDNQRSKEGKTMYNIPIKNATDTAGWNNKMFVRAASMPHRIRIKDVRVERLQDISGEDCIKEGVGVSATDNRIGYPFGIPFNYFIGEDKKSCRYTTPREAFATLIDKVSGKGTWERNPYVLVYEFELVA